MEAFLISILKVAAQDVFVRYARGQATHAQVLAAYAFEQSLRPRERLEHSCGGSFAVVDN